jgi:hypothetical protein
MSLIEINRSPGKSELHKFGLIAFVVLGAIAICLRFVFGVSGLVALLAAGAGLCIFIISLVSAGAARIIYLGLTFAGLPIGLATSFILMATFYFLILTPVGLVLKMTGRDVLERKFGRDSPTYWLPRKQIDDPERYFHQS